MYYPLSDSRSEYQPQPQTQPSTQPQPQLQLQTSTQIQGSVDVNANGGGGDVGTVGVLSGGEDGVKRKATALADLLDSGESSMVSERWKRIRSGSGEIGNSDNPSSVSGPGPHHESSAQFGIPSGITNVGDSLSVGGYSYPGR